MPVLEAKAVRQLPVSDETRAITWKVKRQLVAEKLAAQEAVLSEVAQQERESAPYRTTKNRRDIFNNSEALSTLAMALEDVGYWYHQNPEDVFISNRKYLADGNKLVSHIALEKTPNGTFLVMKVDCQSATKSAYEPENTSELRIKLVKNSDRTSYSIVSVDDARDWETIKSLHPDFIKEAEELAERVHKIRVKQGLPFNRRQWEMSSNFAEQQRKFAIRESTPHLNEQGQPLPGAYPARYSLAEAATLVAEQIPVLKSFVKRIDVRVPRLGFDREQFEIKRVAAEKARIDAIVSSTPHLDKDGQPLPGAYPARHSLVEAVTLVSEQIPGVKSLVKRTDIKVPYTEKPKNYSNQIPSIPRAYFENIAQLKGFGEGWIEFATKYAAGVISGEMGIKGKNWSEDIEKLPALAQIRAERLKLDQPEVDTEEEVIQEPTLAEETTHQTKTDAARALESHIANYIFKVTHNMGLGFGGKDEELEKLPAVMEARAKAISMQETVETPKVVAKATNGNGAHPVEEDTIPELDGTMIFQPRPSTEKPNVFAAMVGSIMMKNL